VTYQIVYQFKSLSNVGQNIKKLKATGWLLKWLTIFVGVVTDGTDEAALKIGLHVGNGNAVVWPLRPGQTGNNGGEVKLYDL
jgi:hypothetical protein